MYENCVDDSMISWARRQIDDLTLDSYTLNKVAIDSKQWSTILVPGTFRVNEHLMGRLEYIASQYKVSDIFAINTFELISEDGTQESNDFCFRIPSSAAEFRKFSNDHSTFNYLLVSDALELAILMTHEDYIIACGKESLLRELIEQSAEEANREFIRFADEMDSLSIGIPIFKELASYYQLDRCS